RPFYVANLEKKLREMADAARDPSRRVTEGFGTERTREQHVAIIAPLPNNAGGRFQINGPNRGVIDGLPDDVAAEFRALIDASGIHPIKPLPLPRKIMLEQVLPFWLDMERTLEAYRTGDRSMLLWNILQSHQTRSYEQAVDVLQALLDAPEHAALAERYAGFDSSDARWQAAQAVGVGLP